MRAVAWSPTGSVFPTDTIRRFDLAFSVFIMHRHCTQVQARRQAAHNFRSPRRDRSPVPDLLKTPERCERTFRRVGRRPAPDRGDITFRPGRGTDRPGERLHHGIERFAQSTEVVSTFGHEYP